MDNRSDVRDFLTSRRARLTPEQVDLPQFGGARRVAGLRRSEVAHLAEVSVEYYTQMERGNLRGVSGSILDAVARALLLDAAERDHLFDLARAANGGRPARGRSPSPRRVRPGIQRILDGQLFPAWVSNNRGDILAANQLGRALCAPLFEDATRPANGARYRFLSPGARDYYRDWERTGRDVVALLRAAVGRDPFDKELTDLIGELSTRSEEFRTLWAAHDVRAHRTGVKRLHHPVVGDVDLVYEGLELPADAGLMLFVFSAEPGSSSEQALDLLASWSISSTAQARLAEPSSVSDRSRS